MPSSLKREYKVYPGQSLRTETGFRFFNPGSLLLETQKRITQSEAAS